MLGAKGSIVIASAVEDGEEEKPSAAISSFGHLRFDGRNRRAIGGEDGDDDEGSCPTVDRGGGGGGDAFPLITLRAKGTTDCCVPPLTTIPPQVTMDESSRSRCRCC